MAKYFTLDELRGILTKANERKAKYEAEKKAAEEKARLAQERARQAFIEEVERRKPSNFLSTYEARAIGRRSSIEPEEDVYVTSKAVGEEATETAKKQYEKQPQKPVTVQGANIGKPESRLTLQKPTVQGANADKPTTVGVKPVVPSQPSVTVQGANIGKPKTVGVKPAVSAAERPVTVQEANIEKPMTVSTPDELFARSVRTMKPVTVQGANVGKEEAARKVRELREAKKAYDIAEKKLNVGPLPAVAIPVAEEKVVQEKLAALSESKEPITAIERDAPVVSRYESVKNSRDFDTVVTSAKDINSLLKDSSSEYLALALNKDYRTLTESGRGLIHISEYEPFDYLNDDEKDIVKYYLATGNETSAENYLKALKSKLNERWTKAVSAHVTKEAYRNPAIGVMYGVAAQFRSPDAFVKTLSNEITNIITGEKTLPDTNSPEYIGATVTNIAGEQIAKRAYDEAYKATGSETLAAVAQGAASIGISIAQQIPRTLIAGIDPTVALSVMATSVAGSTTKAMLDDGATPGQALAMGAVSGTIEYVTEKIPLENLLGIIKETDINKLTSAQQIIYNILKQAGVEAAEESISEISNTVADMLIRQDESEFNKYVEYLMSNKGLNKSDAQRQAALELLLFNTFKAGAGGAVSGAFFGSAASLIKSIETSQMAYEIGRDIKSSGQADSIISTAIGTFSEDSEVYKKARQYHGNTENMPNYVLGKIALTINEYVLNGGQLKSSLPITLENAIYSGKMSNRQADTIINSMDDEDTRNDFIRIFGKAAYESIKGTMAQKRVALRAVLSAYQAFIDNADIIGHATDLYKTDNIAAQKYLLDNINQINQYIELVRNADIDEAEKVSAINNGLARVEQLKKTLEDMRNKRYNITEQINLPAPVASVKAPVEIQQTEAAEVTAESPAEATKPAETTPAETIEVAPKTTVATEEKEVKPEATELPAESAEGTESPVATEENEAKPTPETESAPTEQKHEHTLIISAGEDGSVKAKLSKYVRRKDFGKLYQRVKDIGGKYSDGSFIFPDTISAGKLKDYFNIEDPDGILQEGKSNVRQEVLGGTGGADTQGVQSTEVPPPEGERGTGIPEGTTRGDDAGELSGRVGLADEEQDSGTTVREERPDTETTRERTSSEHVGREGNDTGGTEESSAVVTETQTEVAEETQTVQEEATPATTEETAPAAKNYRIDPEDIDDESPSIYDNIEAIRTLKQIESENRQATPDEQKILAQYKGWGGLADAFINNRHLSKLRDILTYDELNDARATVNNAFYTSARVIKHMYDALKRMGFKGGNLLEPSMGVGNFFGLIPKDLAGKTNLYGVEIDSITGRIAQQLYPDATIYIAPYQDVPFTNGSFDVAIGNVPFLEVYYKYDDGNKYMLHDYFFIKTLDKVKDNGIVMFLTSTGTLDKQNSKARKVIAEKADLIAAARLPNDAFKKNAGTSVTTDLIILKKRPKGVESNGVKFENVSDINGIPINEYFVEHPENILGKLVYEKGMYAQERTQVEPTDSLDALLKKFIERLPKNIIGETTKTEVKIETKEKNGYYEKDGKYYLVKKGEDPVEITGVDAKRVAHFVGIRDAYNKLLNMRTGDFTDEQIATQQKVLKDLYDKMLADKSIKYGNSENRLTSRKMKNLLDVDDDYVRVSGLEVYDQASEKYVESAILTKPVRRMTQTKVDNAVDALKLSMSQFSKVDLEFIKQQTGLSKEQILRDTEDILFESPSGEYVIAPLYLSGNVKQKLAEAEKAAKYSGRFKRNVEALKQVLPEDISPAKISPQLGAAWIQPEYYADFARSVLGAGYFTEKFAYDETSGTWVVPKFRVSGYAESKYGTRRISAREVLSAVMNQKTIKIYDCDGDNRIFNAKATEEAKVKADAMREAFENWIFKDDSRRADITKRYNDLFNFYVPPDYSTVAEYLDFSDVSPGFDPRDYQKNVVARIVFNSGTLVAHGVGTGKTAELVMGAHQLKKLGRVKKPMFVVPLNKTSDFREEYLRIYPTANVLAITDDEAKASKRSRLLSQIASNDWDAIIIGNSTFGLIPVSAETQKEYIQNQINEIERVISEMTATDRRNTVRFVKQLEKTKKSLEAKLSALLKKPKDTTVSFEELGVDALFVDEAHNYKNLSYYTKLNVSGAKGSESARAEDLYMKSEFIRGRNGVVVLATATPITNTVSEMYNMLRYVGPYTLEASGTKAFDAWASAFGKVETVVEMAPDGVTPRVKERFSKFRNVTAMVSMFRQYADIKKTSDVLTTLPKVERKDVISESTDIHKKYIELIQERMSQISWRGQNRQDNMLLITNDGRAMATDMRLVASQLDGYSLEELDLPNSKINQAVRNIKAEYDKSNSVKGTQFVFLDFGLNQSRNKNDKPPRYNFNLYEDLINKLVAAGIPRDEIAVFQDYKKDEAKNSLFARMNNGDIRVLIGSTAAMGEGVNAQKKAVALHHINPPYRPSDIEQREGRLIRHGNDNKNVTVYRYIQQGSFDSYIWQMLARKAEMIEQALNGVDIGDELEDVGDVVLSLREARAIAANNPLLLEKSDLEMKVKRLRAEKRAFDETLFAAKDRANKLPVEIRQKRAELTKLEADIKTVAENQTGPVIRGKQYEKASDAGKAIIAEAKKAKTHIDTEIGTYRGLKLKIYATEMLGKYFINLQGQGNYNIEGSESDTGVIARIKNEVESFGKRLEAKKQEIVKLNAEYEEAKADSQKKFAKQEELDKAVSRLSEINSQLSAAAGLKTDDAVIDDEGFSDSDDDDIQAFKSSDTEDYGETESIPKGLTEIRQNISARFNVPINTGSITNERGKPAGREVRGIFKKRVYAIRVRETNDLRTIAHEFGHALNKKYPTLLNLEGFDDVVEHFREDLEERGYEPEKIPGEAFAEFMATVLRDVDTGSRISPNFFRNFIDTLNNNDLKNFEKTVEESNAYYRASRKARQMASIRSRTEEGTLAEQIREFMLSPKLKIELAVEKFVQDWYDKYSPIKNAEYKLTGGHSVYDRFQYINVAGSKVHATYYYMLTDVNGKYVAPPLIEVFKQVSALGNNAFAEFDLYLKNRRAAYLVQQGIKVYESDDLNDYEKIQEDINRAEAEYPEFDNLAKAVYEYQNTVLWEYGVKTGLISEELFAKLTEDGSDYVPLFRVMDKMYEQRHVGKSGVANQKAPIRRIKGSTRDTYSPIENMLINIDRIMRAGLKNEAVRKFADIIDKSEDSAVYMEKIEPEKLKQVVSTDALKYRLEQALGKDEAEKILSKLSDKDAESLLNTIMEAISDDIVLYKTKNSQKPNVVTVMRDGKSTYYEVHSENLYKALTATTSQNASFIAEFFAKLTQGFKMFTTAMNPYFVISNVHRDYSTGAIKSMTAKDFARYTKDLFGAVADMIHQTDEYKLFLANGGHWASAVYANRNQLAKVLKDLKVNNEVNRSALRRSLEMFGKIVTLPLEVIEKTEQMHRFAEFKRMLKKTNDTIAAARAAAEVTTDFSRHGFKSKEIDKLIPYFQASINGLADLYATFVGNKDYKDAGVAHQWVKLLRLSIYAAVLQLIWNSLIAPLLFGRDEKEVQEAYEHASAYMTNNYWSFYFENDKGEGDFIRIAKPRVYGAISTLMQDLIQYYAKDNEEAFADWGTYIANTFLPTLDVFGFSTLYQLGANEDWRGRQIVPESMEDLPTKFQYNENTSNLAVTLGGMLNLSPLQIDEVLSRNFGFVGRLAKAFPVSGEIDKTLGLGSVLYYDPVYSTDIINNLYDARNEYVEAANGYKVTEGKDPDYTFDDVYNAHKYTRLTSLYSSLNKEIREDKEGGREARLVLNSYLKAMQEEGMTDFDRALSKIAEYTGVELGDITPYPSIPQTVTAYVKTRGGSKPVNGPDGKDLKIELPYASKFYYFRNVHKDIVNAYDKILTQEGITYEAIVEQLKDAKTEIEKRHKEYIGQSLYQQQK